MTETTTVQPMRAKIEEVLAKAAAIDATWAEVLEEVGDRCPPAKAWEHDDDARRDLSYAATGVLRDLLAHVDRGEPVILAKPRPAARELIVMVCDGPGEEYEITYPSPFGRAYDVGVCLQPGEIFSVCPHCARVNGGVIEVDRAERSNEGTLERLQPDTRVAYRDGVQVVEPNPCAGLPTISVWQDRNTDFETDHFECRACSQEIELPGWIEVDWL